MLKCRVTHNPTTFEITGTWFPIMVTDKLGKGKKVLRKRTVYHGHWRGPYIKIYTRFVPYLDTEILK